MIRALRKLTALLLILAMAFALLPAGWKAQAASGTVITSQNRDKKHPLRILAVGNSFSVDGLEYLYRMAESAGYHVTIGNLYIAGCSMDTHLRNLEHDRDSYTYYKFTEKSGGSRSTTNNFSITDALLDEQWDVITLQQASALSGQEDSYRNLSWSCDVGSGETGGGDASMLTAAPGGAGPVTLSAVEGNTSAPGAEEEGGESSAPPAADSQAETPEMSLPEETTEQDGEQSVAGSETEEPPGEETPEPDAPAVEESAAQPAPEEEPAPENRIPIPEEREEYVAPTFTQEDEDGRSAQRIVCGVSSAGTGSSFALDASAETELTYRSDDEDVAEVDQAGNVTLHGGGEAVVTVSAAESETYQAAQTRVAITSRESSYMAQLVRELRQVYADGTERREGWGRKAADNITFGWQLTWAYAKKNIHSSFVGGYRNYNNDQNTMYRAIMKTAQEVVVPSGLFDRLFIPTGTAIQNARTSYAGDRLNRDGVHLTLGLGRYIAAMTWASALGIDINSITYLPSGTNGVIEKELPMIRESVNNAMNTPFQPTQSKCTKTPRLAKPVPNAPVNVAKGIQVNWPQVDGAVGYRLYRKNGDSYKLLNTFTRDNKDQIIDRKKNKDGSEMLTYACTDTAVRKKSGNTYTYYVSAWYQFGAKEYVNGAKNATPVAGDRVETASAKVKQTRLLPPSGVTVKNTELGVKVSWKKVSKATTYRLYRTKSGGKRTGVVTVKSGITSYTDTAIRGKNGSVYTYEVVPCTTLGEGVPSDGKKLTRLTSVTLKRLTQVKSGIKLRWSRNRKATGYSIYRKVNGGSWSKIKTIGKNGTVTYTDKTVKADKTYAYRIYVYKGASVSPVSNSLKLQTTP